MEEQLKIDFEKLLEKSNFSKKNIEIKRKNFNNFIEKGFPNKREENWKFSDLNQIIKNNIGEISFYNDQTSTNCLLYTSPSPRDRTRSRMPSSA